MTKKMAARTKLMCGMVAGLAFLLMAIPAQSREDVTSIAEFDAKTDQERGSTISTALVTIFNHYSEGNPPKAACMATLFARPDSGAPDAPIRGYTLLVHEIEQERADPPGDQRPVERIIFDIIHKECDSN